MSQALIRKLAPWTATSAAILVSAMLLAPNLPLWGRLLASIGAPLAAGALAAVAVRRHLVEPLSGMAAAVAGLRGRSGPLPPDLPIQRNDEMGMLAREIALLAGARNASEIRREENDSKLAALNHAIGDAVFRIDRDGVILSYQPPRDAPGFPPDAAPEAGRRLAEIFPEGAAARAVEALASVFVNEEPQVFAFEIEVAGETRSYEARFARASANEILAIVRDITRVKRAADTRARLDSILDATLDPVVTVTVGGEIRYINPAGRKLLGIQEPRRFGLKLHDFLPEWAQQQIFGTAIPTAVEEGDWQGESALITSDEVEVPIALTAVVHRSEDGEVELLSFIARDQSERKRFDDHLSFLADHDPLTSLYTRKRFVEELGREIARSHRSGATGAVVLVDLDDFKYVNDTQGHRNGDRLLTSLAHVLRQTVRSNDLLARLDGDEFAVLVTETQPSRVDFVIERLLKAVRNHFVHVGEQPIGVTASAGIAFFPEQGGSAEEILARADQALDRAKRQGRDQFVIFKPDDKWQARVDSRLSGEKSIREALAKGRFVLHAQPILDLRTNEIVQYELLIRMLDDQNQLVPPASFLYTAERFGLIRSIDRWVVRQAIRIISQQRALGNNVRLSVNLSGKSVGDLELTTLIEKELSEGRVEPGQLTIEITETTAITDAERSKIFAIALKQIGCRLALDDFGVGSNSMNQLKHLPVDYLKIDGSFIRDLPSNKVDQHLVRAMVEVAKALKKRTVAEFVSSAEILKLVRDSGVDFAQGFFVGKPDAVENLLPGAAEPAAT
jgi:diguanylate cyclase (GGDEF)-like protein/PAS domain S-box-containing protein